MLNTLLSQLVKNVRTLPGWVPLLVICYAASHLFDVSYIEDSTIAKLVRDTTALLVAFLAYQLGDAIDKVLFGKFAKSRLDTFRSSAKRTLNIQEGIYDVSKALADAAGLYTGSSIQVLNEGAKPARSIAVVLIPLGIATLTFAESAWYGFADHRHCLRANLLLYEGLAYDTVISSSGTAHEI